MQHTLSDAALCVHDFARPYCLHLIVIMNGASVHKLWHTCTYNNMHTRTDAQICKCMITYNYTSVDASTHTIYAHLHHI